MICTTLPDVKSAHARGTSDAVAARAACHQVIVYVGPHTTCWVLGGVMVITPTIPATTSRRERRRLERRVLANLLGACPTCGATATITTPGTALTQHRAGCDLADREATA
ncbi:hypothetical protein [Micropruina sp.]|uniref:hypothetical protein n=1 Tax=Micropruina sp. TaxID=2737536 RepID=UPI0039E40265